MLLNVANKFFCDFDKLIGSFFSIFSFSKLITKFHNLFKKRQEPSMPESDHSISLLGGESESIKNLAVSAPKL